MKRIGVFLCHCNLVAPIDTGQVIPAITKEPDVVYAAAHHDLCTDPGLAAVKNIIERQKLDGVVLTTCSPSLHGELFRSLMASIGLGSHQVEIADLRAGNGWPHASAEATQRAIEVVSASLARLRSKIPTTPTKVPVTKKALVIGGGIAGIRAALDIADGGYEVILVEKTSAIGGHMIQYSETFPTLDCPQCIETPLMVSTGQHPNIKIMAMSEVEQVSGSAGNFKVKIKKKATYVDWSKCNGCGICMEACPRQVPSEFDCKLPFTYRKAIFKPFAQAVPNKAMIDKREQLCFIACRDACPVHMNIPGYLRLIASGDVQQAYQVIKNTNPLPSVCGWACYAPCEGACNRAQLDEAPAIRDLKRFVSENVDVDKLPVPEIARNGKKVAIVGSGPAGLAAAHDLALLGYTVTIFEALPVVGGMMRVAIPDYRLPKEALGKDIKAIQKLGVEIKLNSKIESVDPLLEQGYEAVLVALGAHQSLRRGSLVSAISGSPNVLKGLKLQLAKSDVGEVLKADCNTLATSREKVFGAGDVVNGPSSVIEAIASGKRAALSIDRYLKGQPMASEAERAPERLDKEAVAALKARVPSQPRLAETRLMTPEQAKQEAERCLGYQVAEGCFQCLLCEEKCQAKAINHRMKEEFVDVEVGTIVVATGFDLMPQSQIKEYAQDPDIIDGIQFERILCPSGPTAGVVQRPSDRKVPKTVVFISCVGSRDPEHGVPYCSRVCCMYLAKMALLYKHVVHDGQAYTFYMDIRVTGKGYEEFVRRAVEEAGLVYLRGRVSKVFRDGDKIKVWGADTLTGKRVEIDADLVVLGLALLPSTGTVELAQKLGIATDEYGFIAEAHSKLRPMETSVPGIFIAGLAQGPKDIQDTVAQAGGAASKAMALLSKDELTLETAAAREP